VEQPPGDDPARGDEPEPVNEVRLRGRWTAVTARTLPSGDEVVTARLVVPRANTGVDTIDCAVWKGGLRSRALKVVDGTTMEVEGSLRRRFWRTPGGPASRYEVEVTAMRRVPRNP
jgi:single-strand DNA-binding protein